MKNYRFNRLFLFALVTLFFSGLFFSESAHATDPLEAVKGNITAKLDEGSSIAEAISQIIKNVPDDEKTNCCTDAVTAAIELELDTQEVVASAIDSGCEPCDVGDAAYNAGAIIHDIYMAGGCTTGGSTGLSYAPDDVEQPTDRPASPFVPRDGDDIRKGFRP